MLTKEHIANIESELNQMYADGHIKDGAEWTAHKDIELALERLRQAFNNDLELERCEE